MRWLVAWGCGGAAAVLVWACGGAPFVLAPTPDDATAGDAGNDVGQDDATEIDSNDDSEPAPADASIKDGRAVRDATGADAPLRSDGRENDATDRDAIDRDATDADASDADAALPPPPSCAGGFACAPAVPSGWTGPFELYAGVKPLPTCGAQFSGQTLDGTAGLSAPPAACACGCGQAQGVQCSVPAVGFYDSAATCNALPSSTCATPTFTPGACSPVDVTSTCGSALGVVMTVPASTASLGSCSPLAKTNVPSSAWAIDMRACAPSSARVPANCPAGSECFPTPGAPFGSTLCIEQPGDAPSCPAKDYTVRRLYYGGIDDTRGCSTCSCGLVTGAACVDSVSQFPVDGGCTGMPITYGPGHCLPVQQPSDLQLTLAPSGGACTPNPTTPTGSATPAKPVTFCCMP